jgi:hypothetical protein
MAILQLKSYKNIPTISSFTFQFAFPFYERARFKKLNSCAKFSFPLCQCGFVHTKNDIAAKESDQTRLTSLPGAVYSLFVFASFMCAKSSMGWYA